MRIVNKYKEKYTHYIGRGSIFGNPFRIGKDGNRTEVIEQYAHYLSRPEAMIIVDRIYDLPEDAILGCYCHPKACHGEIIIKIWKELHDKKFHYKDILHLYDNTYYLGVITKYTN